MSCTIFYKGNLKRTQTHENVFTKIKAFVKPKGVTKLWSIQEVQNHLNIDFGDERSETLSFCFNGKGIDCSCKVNFGNDESEKSIKHGEKQLEAVFNLFYSITKMFTKLEISDDYGLWADFMDSKRFKAKIRELTESETSRIKKLYDSGYTSAGDIVLAVVAEDLGVLSIDDIDHSQNAIYVDKDYFKEMTECKILEAWICQTAVYKNRGRIPQYKCRYWHGYGYRWEGEYSEVSELEFAFWACVLGIAELFFEKFAIHYPKLKSGTCPKHVQVKRLFNEKFLPLFNDENDIHNKCILAYRYVVSVYEYCGFKFVGKN